MTTHSGDRPAASTGNGAPRTGYEASTACFLAAVAVLVASIFLPYWEMRLNAPQYPKGLFLTVYIDHLEGDIREIDGLNHYIGMAPLAEAAQLERSVAMTALVVLVVLVLATAFVHHKWFAPLTVPAMLLPAIFLLDLFLWLRRFGQNLDPSAALSSAVAPFTPRLLGHGTIAQFSTDASVRSGFWLSVLASILIVAGLHLRRRARRALERASAQAGAAA